MLNEPSTRAPEGVASDAPIQAPPRTNEETELKLLAPIGALDLLRQAPAITRCARNAGVARRLEAVYYDTADRDLFNHGMSLRVRRNGRRYVQTLKRGPNNGQPFVRGEWESPVDSIAPNVASLPVGEIGAPLDRLASRSLDRIFATKVRRRTQQLDLPGAVVEIAFDDGVIEAGERRQPLLEIELEMKAGDPRALYDLGMELLEIAPLRIGTQSKSDRGYDLAFGMSPNPTKAAAPAITAEHTVDDIIGILLGSCQHHLLANQAVAEVGRDPEGVHQMRVALRRMRTALGLLYRELGSPSLSTFNADAKWVGQLLGTARDWDVFVGETLCGPCEAIQSAVDFDGLRRAAERHRIAAYASLREALVSRRYNRFQLSMRHWTESRGWRNELADKPLAVLLEPASAFSGRVLSRLHRKVLRKGEHFRRLQPERRHQVRIALKKLRYATEFFQGPHVGTGETKGFLGCLAHLQDALGHDNDASVTWPFLSTLAQDQVTQDVQRTIGVVMGWQARDRIAVAKTLRKRWHRFKVTPPFW